MPSRKLYCSSYEISKIKYLTIFNFCFVSVLYAESINFFILSFIFRTRRFIKFIMKVILYVQCALRMHPPVMVKTMVSDHDVRFNVVYI